MITIGRIVLYSLSRWDVDAINRRRKLASIVPPPVQFVKEGEESKGVTVKAEAIFAANYVSEGDVLPLVVCRVWPNEFGTEPGVNGQVMLDGNDTHWVTSVREASVAHPESGTWIWPPRV